jgi:hypothetical protein
MRASDCTASIFNNDDKERYVRKSSITNEKCQSFSELLGHGRE